MSFFPILHISAFLLLHFSGHQLVANKPTSIVAQVQPSSVENIPARAVISPDKPTSTKKIISEAEQRSAESQKLEELEKKIVEAEKKSDELEKKLGTVTDYNKDLMKTVFTSLLGTVITVTLGVLGINIVGNLIQRERERAEIIKEVQDSLREYFLEWTSTVVNNLQIRVKWLEYEIASLSAIQLESQGEIERVLALQERSRAIQAVQHLVVEQQGSVVQKCTIFQLEAIESLLQELTNGSDKQGNNQNQDLAVSQLEKEEIEKVISRFKKNLSRLYESTKDEKIKNKVEEIICLTQE